MSLFPKKKEPTQARSKDTINAILESVIQLVDKGDSEGLTTRNIAERAGVSVGSLYQYFPSKEAIFSSLLELHLKNEFKFMFDTLSSVQETTLENAIDKIISGILQIRKRNLKMERALFFFFMKHANSELVQESDERMILELDHVLTVAAHSGKLRHSKTTAFMLFHLVRNTFVATSIYRPAIYDSPDDFTMNLKQTLLGLLGPAT